jgi:hypothetical protein
LDIVVPRILELDCYEALKVVKLYAEVGQGPVTAFAILLRHRQGEGNRENPTPLPYGMNSWLVDQGAQSDRSILDEGGCPATVVAEVAEESLKKRPSNWMLSLDGHAC